MCSTTNDADTRYTCSCPSGFSGVNCQTNNGIQPQGCATFQCTNGGRCQLNVLNQPECICLNGFLGTYCEIRKQNLNLFEEKLGM